jgi:hypothetical protein
MQAHCCFNITKKLEETETGYQKVMLCAHETTFACFGASPRRDYNRFATSVNIEKPLITVQPDRKLSPLHISAGCSVHMRGLG